MKRICLLLMLLFFTGLASAETFRISDIRVDGLQRLSEGTVFSYVPLEVGDQMTPSLGRSTIRDLWETGFFNDVRLSREDDLLVITVEERPAISSISIAGNRQLKTEDLMPALANIGIAEGEIFNKLELDRVRQELIQQYYSRGYYAVNVDTEVGEMSRNRVNLSIQVTEGDQARIRHINIVGNETFSEDELRDEFESDSKLGLFFWQGANKYTREKLSGDLETLRSYYLDRGYLDFSIESTQVAISPDKSDIFITANIREGEVYTVKDVVLTGELILGEETMRRLIMIEPGETFSRKQVEQSVDNITAMLSNIGYAFANVNPVPRINRDTLETELNFFVDPGKRVYVRRVEFRGNTQTKDEVLRREMRQFEGAWFSQSAIDRSKLRLQRLGYIDNVNIETPAVEGSDDQVDIVVSVEEQPSGSFQVGFGFSQVQGLIASISVQQDNFLGSGRRVGFAVSHSDIYTQASVNYTNPYYTDDGVSRGFYARYTEFDQRDANISSFSTSQAAAGVNFGFPISEVDFLRFGLGAQEVDINIGGSFCREDPEDPESPAFTCFRAERPLGISLDENGNGLLSSDERRLRTYRLDSTWSRDSRNHYLNPSRGSLHRLGAEIALPGSTREFYRLNYRFRKYWPLGGSGMAFSVKGDVAYGDSYDNYDDDLGLEPVEVELGDNLRRTCQPDEVVSFDDGLPFYEHFYGGGVSDIRGFEDNSLGPKDQFCRSVGGDFKVIGGIELAFPLPNIEASGTRLAWFVDVGNVFRNYDSFETDKLRASTGLALTWQAPVGPIIINVATPLKEREGDETQVIQFSFGQTF
ncbi:MULTISPECIES: outer membrane protein assembly factor BamA [unclassified Wenzhouxiangella]|uniref:outer membrane protein assembly factor BamA n=1 Tax=unclassified Wenzhouxiangella TaxID=2613841 RepID=UPI000E329DF8|nr:MULTISPECIES: outer membrane protein assembly factor BamA [unclassified Wenzhouxiangella]RFF27097.1 outer membrane protein assembly factor BamA [Wenzhouxiangella sp. 15181]RFP69217.1 outer membrane protein assembly factor BamA [Wenzhouxiangella sp. 15190]